MRKFSNLLTTALFCMSGTALFAQTDPGLDVLKNAKGKITFARLRPEETRPLKEAPAFLQRFLDARPGYEFRMKREQTDALGMTHQRFHQYFQGVRIEGAEYLVHSRNGNIQTINGDFDNVSVPSVTPAISPAQAISKALAAVPAQTYGWQDKASEARYKEVQHDQHATLYPTPELVIAFDDSIAHAYRLEYKVHVYAAKPMNDYNVFIDAATGNVTRKVNLTCKINTPGTGATLYSGQQNITVDSYIGLYRLQETRSGAGGSALIQTFNMNGGTGYNEIDFLNPTPNWTVPDAGLDVHWGMEKVYDYFQQVFGRNSYDGHGSPLIGYVHADLHSISPGNYADNDNASWNGTNKYVTYGDGQYKFRSVTSLDIVAHEIGHGFTQAAVNLEYTGESGALHEGLSDIWGACVSYWAAPNKNAWQIGEEIMKNGSSCLRSLRDPYESDEPNSPKTYKAGNWNDNSAPHINCTVLGYWFYVLSQGGSAINDKGQYYNVTGIGIDKAQRIVYHMETAYLTSNATYETARTAAIEAVRDLYGANSCEEVAVTNAWYAVGVGNSFVSSLTTFSVNGPETICRGGSGTFTATNVPAKSLVTWTSTNSVTSIAPAANGMSAVVTNNSGSATSTGVRATVTMCTATKDALKIVNLGSYPIGIVSVNNAHSCDATTFIPQRGGSQFYDYYMELQVIAEGATSYGWTKLSGNQFYSNLGNGKVGIGFKSASGGLTLRVDANGPCGGSSQIYSFISSGCPLRMDVSGNNAPAATDQSLVVYPNPVTDQLTITLPNALVTGRAAIRITDVYGRQIRRLTNVSATNTLSMLGLPTGVYVVEVFDNDKMVLIKKIIKQ